MAKKKNNKIIGVLSDGWFFVRFKLPAYVTLVTLYALALTLLSFDNLQAVLTYALALIGITIALSQTSFEYANTIKEEQIKEGIVTLGEWLLASSVWVAISLLMVVFRFYLTEVFVAAPDGQTVLDLVTLLIDSFALLNFTLAARGIYKAINGLGYFLWRKMETYD